MLSREKRNEFFVLYHMGFQREVNCWSMERLYDNFAQISTPLNVAEFHSRADDN